MRSRTFQRPNEQRTRAWNLWSEIVFCFVKCLCFTSWAIRSARSWSLCGFHGKPVDIGCIGIWNCFSPQFKSMNFMHRRRGGQGSSPIFSGLNCEDHLNWNWKTEIECPLADSGRCVKFECPFKIRNKGLEIWFKRICFFNFLESPDVDQSQSKQDSFHIEIVGMNSVKHKPKTWRQWFKDPRFYAVRLKK